MECYDLRRQTLLSRMACNPVAASPQPYLDRRRWLLSAPRQDRVALCAAMVAAPAEQPDTQEAEMQRKLREKKLRKQEQAKAKEALRAKQMEAARARGEVVAVPGGSLQEQVTNALNTPQPATPEPKSTDLLGRLEPGSAAAGRVLARAADLSLIHISEPTRLLSISYAVFCLKKKKKNNKEDRNVCSK
eukprot:TRINITY_DN3047_c0_g1_i2.p1 TRINITY_DN3047_c0_g1~~TRINITY_DN3047_c0_g1_i2.p1  ORF type:complete len:189 (-),score=53.35 TRINITY_DN3047_c0_g1_i2:76-642(-)